MLTQDLDRWIAWPGGKSPVAPGTFFRCRFRDGRENCLTQTHSVWDWSHNPNHPRWDTVAYFVPSIANPQLFEDGTFKRSLMPAFGGFQFDWDANEA